ncbi:MAG: hypothetical protein Q8N30_08175 [Methylococcales bacterium]|nr:hypothetical protein [Methylococcales bacterium]
MAYMIGVYNDYGKEGVESELSSNYFKAAKKDSHQAIYAKQGQALLDLLDSTTDNEPDTSGIVGWFDNTGAR